MKQRFLHAYGIAGMAAFGPFMIGQEVGAHFFLHTPPLQYFAIFIAAQPLSMWWVMRYYRAPKQKPALVVPETARPLITARQVLLVEKITSGGEGAYTAMMDLWENLYGKPPDYDRPMMELAEEITVALKALT